MTETTIRPFGTWRSPISAEVIVAQAVGLGQIALDGEDIYWVETRPGEGGRGVIMRYGRGEGMRDITPPGFNVRTRVHEYGSGAFAVAQGTLYFSNFVDQRIYRQAPGGLPEPITTGGDFRYADGVIDRERGLLFYVREDHTGREPENTLVSVDLKDGGTGRIVVSGNDFYASPRLSPDRTRLAWLTWNHPSMPWDGTELWLGELTQEGSVAKAERVAGGPEESLFQPQWSPDGVLYFVSDRSGWWNLYRWRSGSVERLTEREAEFGRPQWVFGLSTYGFESAGRIVCAYSQQGRWSLATLDTRARVLDTIETGYTDIDDVRVMPGCVVFCGASPAESASLVRLDLATGRSEVLKRSLKSAVDPGYLSSPRPIAFPTGDGMTAHALFYAPTNRDYHAPPDERPPLIVKSHGGPTSAAGTSLDLKTQYWTSRGFAVLDVNYRGSTGYGRAYRQSLYGQWGIADVDDCINGARYLVEAGEVDGNRLVIRGGSAGGYTTLCALAFRDMFKAGASYYGVSDLEALARDTHKFESRYLERLVGPYPQRLDLYRERSPIHFAEKLSCPVIFFQGLEDRVVPPDQAERMVQALRAKGLPVAYVAFPGEQHGFRQARNIQRALEAELYFYAVIVGFTLPDSVEPVAIENL